MSSNFNNSAWFYDKLSRLVYGKALINAQVYLLRYIPANSNLLIVGGGTGWILDEITKVHPAGLNITYVDVAANMIALSKKRNIGNNKVIFINAEIESVSLMSDFDVVLTPFLLDNFTETTLVKIFNQINYLLKPRGIWLNCSFQLTGKWWHMVLLKTMFIFFKITCKIEASQLPGIEKQFEVFGYKNIAQKTFFSDFVVARVYEKRTAVASTRYRTRKKKHDTLETTLIIKQLPPVIARYEAIPNCAS